MHTVVVKKINKLNFKITKDLRPLSSLSSVHLIGFKVSLYDMQVSSLMTCHSRANKGTRLTNPSIMCRADNNDDDNDYSLNEVVTSDIITSLNAVRDLLNVRLCLLQIYFPL